MNPDTLTALLEAREWAERDELQFAALVFCLEQTQPLIPITRFN